MPQPVSMSTGQGRLVLTKGFTASTPRGSSPRLDRAVERMLYRLEDQTGLELVRQVGHVTGATLTVDVLQPDTTVQGLDEDESYHLDITSNAIQIHAATTTGAMHALETMLQLVQPAGSAYMVPAAVIDDSPRFHWRGLMIDCGRHFEPIDVLKRNLDAMAAVKLNVFHWHLTEDQGFRIESKRFPRLTAEGSDGLFYTQEQARELVQYARDRGIRIVPEFEMPGHSVAWLVAYPELNSGTQPTGIRREFGVSDYVLDPTREATYKFINLFLTEMASIFPDQYVHIGGDEAPAPDWKTNPRIVAFMKSHDLKDNDALQAYFNKRVLAILTKLNRRMVGWDEIFNPALPKDVVIQSWRGEQSLSKGATQGYQGVLSAPYYLDGMQPAVKPYLADPISANTTLTPEQQKLILGGEICMWGEHLDGRTIDSRIWPRSAAIAERFWSPQNVRDVDSMYSRLDAVSVELETLGLRHLTSEDAELRGLAGSEHIAALRTFASAFEPVGFGDRSSEQHTSQRTALTSFVDAVRPDPPIRHQLELAAKRYLAKGTETTSATSQSKDLLERFFSEVNASMPSVNELIKQQPRLQPMQERADQLAVLTGIGSQAIHFLETGTSAPAQWKQDALARIEGAKKPSGLVFFDFLSPLTDLVNATR
ncbi:beta-N-acetylhexosaminidase [Terriglobus roseus]|nr:family 20 glycosylhydrolase [Terriglobus roseus]